MSLIDVRVLIVGDNPLVRAGLSALLTGQGRVDVVGQVAAPELAEMLDVYRADVIAWVVGWDTDGTLSNLSDLSEDAPPVLLLLNDETHAGEALAAGARGLLLQDSDADALTAALTALAHDLVVLHPDLTVVALPEVKGQPLPPPDLLTPRELEVLNLLAEGLPNKLIANQLGISEHTVKFHVNAVMNKLGVQSRTEAVVHATRLGLIVL
jgi:DNA-binding NarL/FixJ family response regulator